MKLSLAVLPLAAALSWAAAPALAAPNILVDFEKNWDYLNGDINDYYNGGSAADGSVGSQNFKVSFVNVSGLSTDPAFPAYSGAPSPLGVAYAHTFGDQKAFLNVDSGATGGLSFFYASTGDALGAVKAYSGLNGTGTLLGTFDLLANNIDSYDKWTSVDFAFAGIARSFDLTGSANLVALDNVATNVAAVPEPSTVALMLAGGAMVLLTARRRRG